MLDCFASERQYAQHLAALWQALDPTERGTFYVHGRLADEVRSQGLDASIGYPPKGDTPCLVASFTDSRSARQSGRPVCYLEHGAGQTYDGDLEHERHPSYSGGAEHEGTTLFLSPSETVARRWRSAYPDVTAVAVGCPYLDPWHRRIPISKLERRPTVAISFHADARWVPESSSAWPFYDPHLPIVVAGLRDAGLRVLGHAHPRIANRLLPRWDALGVDIAHDWAQVLNEADCFVVDNSSAGYEFASTDRPTVWLNAPWYRREIKHGLRFWSLIPGEQCDTPDEIVPAVCRALDDPQQLREQRRAVTAQVYAAVDGWATERAIQALRSVLGGPSPR